VSMARGACSRRVVAASPRCSPTATTTAPWFDGFREVFVVRGLEAIVRPIADVRTWLLRVGWRRHGLIGVGELQATG
jgi:hypothetical protein